MFLLCIVFVLIKNDMVPLSSSLTTLFLSFFIIILKSAFFFVITFFDLLNQILSITNQILSHFFFRNFNFECWQILHKKHKLYGTPGICCCFNQKTSEKAHFTLKKCSSTQKKYSKRLERREKSFWKDTRKINEIGVGLYFWKLCNYYYYY